MNGIQSVLMTVFPKPNTPGKMCSAAEMESDGPKTTLYSAAIFEL